MEIILQSAEKLNRKSELTAFCLKNKKETAFEYLSGGDMCIAQLLSTRW